MGRSSHNYLSQNDGTDKIEEYDYELGQSSTINECMFGERSGYGFVGWSTTASGSADSSYWPDTTLNLTGNVDLWAVWSSNVYTFTYVDMSGIFPNRKIKYGEGAHVTVGRVLSDDGNLYKYIPNLWIRSGIDLKGYDTSGTKFNTDPMTYNPWGEYDDGGTLRNYITAFSDMTFYAYWDESVITDIYVTVTFSVSNDPDNILRAGYPKLNGTILDVYADDDYESYTWYIDNKVNTSVVPGDTPVGCHLNLETADMSKGQHEIELIVSKEISGTTYYYSWFGQFEIN